jgi:hypothetical protein
MSNHTNTFSLSLLNSRIGPPLEFHRRLKLWVSLFALFVPEQKATRPDAVHHRPRLTGLDCSLSLKNSIRAELIQPILIGVLNCSLIALLTGTIEPEFCARCGSECLLALRTCRPLIADKYEAERLLWL